MAFQKASYTRSCVFNEKIKFKKLKRKERNPLRRVLTLVVRERVSV